MQFFLFLAFLLFLVFVAVAFQNPTEVDLSFIKWTFTGPLAAMLALPFAAGLLAGISLLIPAWWKKLMAARINKRRVQELEKELSDVSQRLAQLKPSATEPVTEPAAGQEDQNNNN